MVVQFNSVKFSSSSDFNGLKKPLNAYFVVPQNIVDSLEKENLNEQNAKK